MTMGTVEDLALDELTTAIFVLFGIDGVERLITTFVAKRNHRIAREKDDPDDAVFWEKSAEVFAARGGTSMEELRADRQAYLDNVGPAELMVIDRLRAVRARADL